MSLNITAQNPTANISVDAALACTQVKLAQESAKGGVDVSVMGGNGAINMWQPGVNINITSTSSVAGVHKWMKGNSEYYLPEDYTIGPNTTIECMCCRAGFDKTEGHILYANSSPGENVLIDFTDRLIVWTNGSPTSFSTVVAPDTPVLVQITSSGTLYVDNVQKGQYSPKKGTSKIRLFNSRKSNILFLLKLYEGDDLIHHLLPCTDFDGQACIYDKVANRLLYPPNALLSVGD